jgi:ADP-ribosyl-[dinitrogen reductase] hydrolase
MRCAPYGIVFRQHHDALVNASRTSSRITHYDTRCRDACAVFNAVIAAHFNGCGDVFANALSLNPTGDVREVVESVAHGTVEESDLQNTGYVVHTLQTSLYDALTADSAEAAIIQSVNRGGDADTLGAVTGALAGARFGVQGLPKRWLAAIDEREELERLADALVTREFPPVDA